MEKIKYFVSEVVEYKDGTKDSPAIYIKNDEEQAVSLALGDYAKWMKAENVECVTVCCYTNDNRIIESKCHRRKTVDEKEIAIDNAIATYKANPTDENLAKIKEAVTAE